ncbi:MAG: hypothetical protein ACI9G1_001171 [Pirellulaceae bacterium]|jgi:hypothetical protein
MRFRYLITSAFLAAVAIVNMGGLSAADERPRAPKLLPKDTLVFARISDIKEMREKFDQTALGRIRKDEKIKPFLEHLYGSALDAFKAVETEVGVPLNDVLAIPQGELCFAIVAPETGPPAVVLLIDCGKQIDNVNKLIERGEQELTNSGGTRKTEDSGDTELVIYRGAGEERELIKFERDGVLCITSDISITRDVLARWNGEAGEEDECLLDNRKFVTVMRQSSGIAGERPQITFFADPIETARIATRGNFAAQTGLALLVPLGLDGIQAVGGGTVLATEEFDGITHLHIMLDNPRTGVLEVLTFQPGDTTPEAWVPKDTAGYATVNWDPAKSYDLVHKLFDSFRGEGKLQEEIDNRINVPVDINLEEDVIAHLNGRITYISWMEKPAKVNSGCNMVGIKLQDAAGFRRTLEHLVDLAGDRLDSDAIGTTKYYKQVQRNDSQPEIGIPIRRPDPCFGIVGDYLLLSDSSALFKEAVKSHGIPGDSLADQPDFKVVSTKIARHAGTRRPVFAGFQRPDEALRALYEVAVSKETKGLLDQNVEGNPVLQALKGAMEDHPLPAFAELQKYLAPRGSYVTSDETGIHYVGLDLRRK